MIFDFKNNILETFDAFKIKSWTCPVQTLVAKPEHLFCQDIFEIKIHHWIKHYPRLIAPRRASLCTTGVVNVFFDD